MSETVAGPAPFAVVDVHYVGTSARAACVVGASWTDGTVVESHVVEVPNVAPYVPGRFFERELPCILAVLPRVSCELFAIVIDGYVELDDQGTPGLGARLYAHLSPRCPVIGVAKSAYAGSTFARAVVRGTGTRPLFVTAAGIGADEAARLVNAMSGPHRIPTLLERADHLARGLTR